MQWALDYPSLSIHSSFKLISAEQQKIFGETRELCDRENDSHMIFHALDLRLSEVQINREIWRK